MEVHESSGVVTAVTTQARVSQDVARRAINRVVGMPATEAVTTLSFAAGNVCEPVARLIEAALAHATRTMQLSASVCIVAGGEVGEGETVVRVRRQAHGMATWITTKTSRISIDLSVPTLLPVTEATA